MRLVVREERDGVWVQLEGETSVERMDLDAQAAQGQRTSGPGLEQVPRLQAMATTLGRPVRVIRE